MQDTITIRTPEGVRFQLILAGPMRRLLAWAVDMGLFLAIISTLGALFRFTGAVLPGYTTAIPILAIFLLNFAYNIVGEWYWSGQTPGKHLLRIRVMDVHGLRLHFSQIVMRNLMRTIDALPVFYSVGLAAMLLNRKNQRLGDFAANTIVVYTPKRETPDVHQVLAGKYNSFRQAPHLEARLRQKVSPEMAAILVDLLFRRDELNADARVALYHEVAAFLRALVPFPDTITESLSDEQYLRNTVDTLYRNRKLTEPS
ncbi:MAG: RDD family protein [Candidatus Hydrogenedentes bacterium]|nr:RDD family protein [Candidatus Hydrogenedentota bacterium]